MDQSQAVLRRRRLQSPNPLFINWLREMESEAKAKQWKSYKHFKKAACSLTKFPLVLESGKACAILEGFGQRICLLIDQKLTALSHEMGCSVGEALKLENQRLLEDTLKTNSRNKTSRKRQLSPEQACSSSQASPAKKCKIQSSVGYCPKNGSAAFALIIALHDFHASHSLESAISKEELIHLAQPFCNSSFTVPSVPGSYYTAWSAMGDLAKKELVTRHRNPARYSLTSNGIALAIQLKAEVKNEQQNPLSATSDSNRTNLLPIDESPAESVSEGAPKVIHYVSESEEEVQSKCESNGTEHDPNELTEDRLDNKEEAGRNNNEENDDGDIGMHEMAILEPDETIADETSPTMVMKRKQSEPRISVDSFLARCILDDETQEAAVGLKDDSFCEVLPLSERLRLSSETKERQISDSEICPKETAEVASKSASRFPFCYITESRIKVRRREEAFRVEGVVEGAPGVLVQCDMDHLAFSGCRYVLDLDSLGQLSDGQVMAFLHEVDAPECAPELNSKPAEERKEKYESKSVERKTMVKHSASATANPDGRKEPKVAPSLPTTFSREGIEGTSNFERNSELDLTPPRVLHKLEIGEADIRLIVDTREHFGMGRVKQLLLPALLKNGTPCEVRPLPVGDFAWLVRKKGNGNQEIEAVIDFLVERKRVDDLASSITDGRYREQKARMKKSGFSKIIYLIENFGGMKHTSLAPDTLMQALTNSQVVDGCMITFCRNAEETVAYLSAVTQQLQVDYSSRKLKILDRWNEKSDMERQNHCVAWSSFMEAAVKTPDPEVKILFAKQLLRFSGTGPESVEAVLSLCPTPQSMIAKCSSLSEQQWDKAFSYLKRGNLQKKVGAALSRAICMFYSAK